MKLTHQELSLLAGFVCERYDSLMEIANEANPNIIPSFKNGARKDAHSISSLNFKLRPYYKKGAHH